MDGVLSLHEILHDTKSKKKDALREKLPLVTGVDRLW
jgi:hypothetical protein